MTDATTGIPVWAEIRKATQFDYKKTVEEQWQTSWLSDFIQTDSLEKYALEIAATGELVGLGAYRDMPEGVLVYVEYIESAPHSNPTLAGRRKYKGIGAALLAYGIQLSIDYGYGGAIYLKAKTSDQGTLYSGFWSNSIQQIRSIPAFDRWRSGKRVIFAIFEGGVIMLQEKYAKLDDLAAPNCYVAPPTSEDLSYVVHFRQICKRYNIDFSSADSDEKNFVMKMAEKSFMPKRA